MSDLNEYTCTNVEKKKHVKPTSKLIPLLYPLELLTRKINIKLSQFKQTITFQSVLENEEGESDNVESIMGNLVANQKLLPFKFTSHEVTTVDEEIYGDINLQFALNECAPKSMVGF